MAEHAEVSWCFYCGQPFTGYGESYGLALKDANEQRLSHQAGCPKNDGSY